MDNGRLFDPIGLDQDESTYQCAKRVAKRYTVLPVNDKYKHCMTAGEIYKECGPLSAYAASVGKEIQDMFGPGDADWEDLWADLDGIKCVKNPGQDECGDPQSLEDCCKSKGRKP
jgi:hypothetical protein